VLLCRELGRKVSCFVLRRTADIIAKYLPPLTTYIVFCSPTALQVRGLADAGLLPLFSHKQYEGECGRK
jgi:DNA repair and recombination protein RAD54B